MFHDVLVPLTGSAIDESAVPHAIAMAQLTGARVHLLHVLEKPRSAGFERPVDPVDWHVRKLEAEAYLDRTAAHFRDAGIEAEAVLLEGQAAEHIINYARRSDSDVIVMATGSAGRGSVGAVVGQVLWRAYISALLVRAPSGAAASRAGDWVAAHDGDGVFGPAGSTAAGALAADVPAARLGRYVDDPQPGPGAASADARRGGSSGAAGGPEARGDGPEVRGGGRRVRLGEVEGDRSAAGASVAASPLAELPGTGPTSTGSPGVAEHVPAERVSGAPGVRYRRVLAALDGSKRAECVLPMVRLVGVQHEAKVLLAHIVTGPELPRLTPATEEDLELARRLTERNEEEAGKYLQDVRARLALEAETRLQTASSVSPRLHDLTQAEDVDLVILSAHGYTGESRWPYGDVATNFIGYGSTPLLLVQDVQRQPDRQVPDDVTAEHWGR